MSEELNESQKRIAETTEGMIVVDAGPGTGKTHTIVRRYVNILRKDVDPKDVILLTFTRNAASEMEERIKGKLFECGMSDKSKHLMTSTFDSFCYSIVMESPEAVSRFFGMEEHLTRSSRLIDNETLNKTYFEDYMDRFLSDRGEDYGDCSTIASQNVDSLYKMINRLMSRGVVPLDEGWFGSDGDDILYGDKDALFERLSVLNNDQTGGKYVLSKYILKLDSDEYSHPTGVFSEAEPLPDSVLKEAVNDTRKTLVRMIHDIYYGFIRKSVIDDRLTFGLVSSFAFVVLYSDAQTRKRMSCRYLMIDEFQDTNSNQLMIALMLLNEPNLCVVGDWKQGIYGFRHVSVENIIHFDERVSAFTEVLNKNDKRVRFPMMESISLPLVINYRSSQAIIDAAFECLYINATDKENLDKEELDKIVIRINAGRDDIGDDTRVEMVSADSNDEEIREVLRRIENYVNSGNYTIHEGDVARRPDYSDIAVLCRTTKMCRSVNEAAMRAGIPVFLQGDVEVMSTREGKLLLAWLKYLNNSKDRWGLGTILADMGYPLLEMKQILSSDGYTPSEITDFRKFLFAKKRRITDLVATIFDYYQLNNDVTQTIISVISSSHRNSLLTISDVIRMIETDIVNATTYPVDGYLSRKAVTIQTMHKSKGLEYPIVIVAGVNRSVIPNTRSDGSEYISDDLTGIRCTEEVSHIIDDHLKVQKSWKTFLVKKAMKKDYSEERRLMFVALSRAKQYVTITSNHRPSSFFKWLSNKYRDAQVCLGRGDFVSGCIEDAKHLNTRPEIKDFEKRRQNIGVHDILVFDKGETPSEGGDEICGKGMEYGTKVHKAAEAIALGKEVTEEYPELDAVRGILKSLDGAEVMPEVECSLPFNDLNTTLRGIIDLLAVYPDHVEVHDYKTDVECIYEPEYRIQLSVYAHAASAYFKRPASCVIDYVSQGKQVMFDPLDISIIAERIVEYSKI